LWAETFDEKFTNIFALQDSISNSVARSLSINLSPKDKNLQQPTHKAEAYQAYMLGIYFWNKRTKEDLQKGVWNFQQAIELDPNYAEAYAGLADCYNLLSYYKFSDNSEEIRTRGREAAEKALVLNDSLAEAHIAVAFYQSSDEARRSLERAIELSPYSATARIRYGWHLLRDQKPETMELAERQIRLAQEYDPLSHISNGALCGILMFRRNFEEAVNYCRKSYDLAPQNSPTRMALADALFFAGQKEEAIEVVKKEIEAGRNKDAAKGTLGHYYAMLGQRDEAENILAELKPKAGNDVRLLLDLILINYSLGKRDESLGYFRQAYEKKLLPSFMVFDPIWEKVTKDPEVKEILK
jgi:tetratricopeptide (TPR) repeat protein